MDLTAALKTMQSVLCCVLPSVLNAVATQPTVFYAEFHKSAVSDLVNAKSIFQLLPRFRKSMMGNFCKLPSNACLELLEYRPSGSKIAMRSSELFDHLLGSPPPIY